MCSIVSCSVGSKHAPALSDRGQCTASDSSSSQIHAGPNVDMCCLHRQTPKH